MSGPDALRIAAVASQSQHRAEWATRHAIRFECSISLERLGEIDVALFVWPDSRSYTGQPSVEIHTLGNVVLLQSIQAKLIQCGALLAEPGEFTLRAFLAGRLDLTQCEAVLGVIHAANSRSLNVALSQLAGGLSEPLSHLRTSMVTLLADIEAGLDFVDEDIEFISPLNVQSRLSEAKNVIDHLKNQMESRAAQSVEQQVVVVGPPNAGKSSLVNALAKKQISIVSAQPGTTRDYVRFRVDWDGVIVDIVDTAGIEETDQDTPRGMAQGFTITQISQADLVLCCLAVDDLNAVEWSCDPVDQAQLPVWLVRTKCDLVSTHQFLSGRFDREFVVSMHQSASVEQLVRELRAWAVERRENFTQVVPLTAARCQASLMHAGLAISNALDASVQTLGDEIVAGEIRLALEEIGMVAGTVYTDDILDALFSRFCIGK